MINIFLQYFSLCNICLCLGLSPEKIFESEVTPYVVVKFKIAASREQLTVNWYLM